MSFESLTHTPEFELPPNAPSASSDIISLLEELHLGLHKVIVSLLVRRGKYEQIATILCQENPSKQTRPLASADDIADYCMMIMQYHMDKTDTPGTYRVLLLGPPGRGRFERSKHVDLSEGDGMARSKTVMSEGELIEQQSHYISELHAQSIAMQEILQTMLKPLLQENKEQMKIISESARSLAEIERDRMHHDLEMRIHADDMKIEEMKEEMKSKRWQETMSVVNESGAVEAFMKAAMKKFDSIGGKVAKDDPSTGVENPTEPSKSEASSHRATGAKKKNFKKKSSDKRRPSKLKGNISSSTADAIKSSEDLTPEQLDEVFQKSAMGKAMDNPLALTVEVLKMSIDANDQWDEIKKTLTTDQFNLFKEIIESSEDSEVESLLRKMYEMKGARRLLKLEQLLEDDQKTYIEQLFEVAKS